MGQTVGNILISYDVSDKNPEVKQALIDLGYIESWYYIPSQQYPLPDTTLVHLKKTSDQALIDMQNVCRAQRVNLQKFVAVLADEFVGIR